MRKVTTTRYRRFYAMFRLVELYIDGNYIGSIKLDQMAVLNISKVSLRQHYALFRQDFS